MTEQGGESERSTPRAPEAEHLGLYNSRDGTGQVFRKTLVQALTVLVVVVLALLAKETIYILLLMFAGTLLAVLIDFLGRQVMRVPVIPHWLAITFVLTCLAAVLALILVLVVPMAVAESAKLAGHLDEGVRLAMRRLQEMPGGQFLLGQVPTLEERLSDSNAVWQGVTGAFATTIEAVTGISVIVIVGVFLAYAPGMYEAGFLHLVPLPYRDRTTQIMAAVGTTLRRWLVGQLVSMVLLAVTTWVMLALLGIPQALILALITGLMTFVPYLGPLIALIPILIVSLVESPHTALYVFLLYMAIQNVEASVIMPLVFHRTASIPPVLGVISQILFGSLFGFLGFVLAVPLMAVVLQVVKMAYVEDILGDGCAESD